MLDDLPVAGDGVCGRLFPRAAFPGVDAPRVDRSADIKIVSRCAARWRRARWLRRRRYYRSQRPPARSARKLVTAESCPGRSALAANEPDQPKLTMAKRG